MEDRYIIMGSDPAMDKSFWDKEKEEWMDLGEWREYDSKEPFLFGEEVWDYFKFHKKQITKAGGGWIDFDVEPYDEEVDWFTPQFKGHY